MRLIRLLRFVFLAASLCSRKVTSYHDGRVIDPASKLDAVATSESAGAKLAAIPSLRLKAMSKSREGAGCRPRIN